MTKPHPQWGAWLRGRCEHLGRGPLAWCLGLVPTGRSQEAAAEEIETCAPEVE
jgi:hypothetical protein